MGAAVLVLLTAAVALVLFAALRGPGIVDRVQATNALGTVIVLWLCSYGTAFVDGDVVDIAMIYALTSFVATIAVLKYLEHGDLGADPQRRLRPPTNGHKP